MQVRIAGWLVGVGLLVPTLGCGVAPGPATKASPAPATEPRAASATGVRTVHFVRHGAYAETDPADPELGRHLVPLGARQAELVAARLAGLLRRPDALYASSMTRARETAEIIAKELKLEPEIVRDLRECGPPQRGGAKDAAAAAEAEVCRAQLERALGRFLVPAPERDQVDVVVAHGNVIRYLMCRALELDPLAWSSFGVTHTGITTIEIRPDGRRRVLAFNDHGHLPAELQTSSGTEALARPKP